MTRLKSSMPMHLTVMPDPLAPLSYDQTFYYPSASLRNKESLEEYSKLPLSTGSGNDKQYRNTCGEIEVKRNICTSDYYLLLNEFIDSPALGDPIPRYPGIYPPFRFTPFYTFYLFCSLPSLDVKRGSSP
ncbi:hypothetical protein AVEN_40653-1 [Araneus ventricosus]|uniref:Uncharacterized protein n=1 Tax=Araneus ventricosus TaxID=182803 RepID=A0A4Y2H3R1_ARAVE|nr:hypothetical protein AVEN_40653-1 [Araneus ventricosus]